MTFDPKVPADLKKMQQWFGSIIARPIDINSSMDPVSPSGRPMEEEAYDFISPSHTLRPAQRIELYNQQYWWRLLGALHDNFPMVTRLFGYDDFNQAIGIPYLQVYPPETWTLNPLGDYLPNWIKNEYEANDKQLVWNAAKIDCAYVKSFMAKREKSLSATSLSGEDLLLMADKPMKLQSHVHLFKLPYDLFQFRTEFLKKEPEYWVENDFPKLRHFPKNEPGHFILYRKKNQVDFLKISQNEYSVLQRFKLGWTVDGLCEWLEKQPEDSPILAEALNKLREWMQRWVSQGWLKIGRLKTENTKRILFYRRDHKCVL